LARYPLCHVRKKTGGHEGGRETIEMAKHDPQLIAAGWKLNNTAYALDQELAL
jgi:hypothetical protein